MPSAHLGMRCRVHILTFCSSHMRVYRDIKPENLLFTSRDSKAASIKVVNFAMAKMVHGESVVGNDQLTWPYCSPEILASLGGFSSRVESIRNAEAGNNASGTNSTNSSTDVSKQAIGVKCDIWSVGIVLYVLLSGAHPFDLDGRQTRDQIVGNILLGKFAMSGESSIWSQISREAKDLLTKFLDVDPEKRPSAAEALDHEWFASPDTPRSPLSVSVSDGLGQYQRLMRTKFRVSTVSCNRFVDLAGTCLIRGRPGECIGHDGGRNVSTKSPEAPRFLSFSGTCCNRSKQ